MMKKLLKQNVYQDALQTLDKQKYEKLKLGTLSAMLTGLICVATVPSYASDIEIYTKPSSTAGSGVVVMMLDTSGSMSRDIVGISACDFPDNYTYDDFDIAKNTNNATFGNRPYDRIACKVSGRKKYSYALANVYRNGRLQSQTWYNCIDSNNRDTCVDPRKNGPNTSSFSNEQIDTNIITNYDFTRITFYFKKDTAFSDYNKIGLDRISRLKDALYTLAIMPVYNDTTKTGIKSDVKIGIGTFPYYETDWRGNVVENNKRGYIRIPADEWGDIGSDQRTKVIDLIKNSNFKGIGGTPTSAAYAEAAAYLLGTTTGGGDYSGINLSKAINSNLVSGSNYVSPLDKSPTAAECSGQGIYFLTDGQPQSPKDTNTTTIMAKALNLNTYSLTTGLPNNGSNDNQYYKSDWQSIGSFAKSLNDVNVIKNALGVSEAKRQVLTAVVGFGSVFDGDYDAMNDDAKNAYQWGLLKASGGSYGVGGFIAAQESQQVVDSLNDFIGAIGGSIPSISTGSSTIPKDALNPETIQGFSYFPQFEPKVEDGNTQQIWFGNLKKYYVLNNSVYASESGGSSNVVSSKGLIRDLNDIWGAKSGQSYDLGGSIYKKGGALSRLLLGTEISYDEDNKKIVTGRKLLTDYEFDNGVEKTNYNLIRIDRTYTTDTKTKTDTQYAKPLMAVLGYNITDAETTNGLDLTNRTADVRQIGSILHSLPVLLTQEGKLVAKYKQNTSDVYIDSESREDYVLFGTAQGMMHVVDADTGLEKFTFLPKEMLLKQPETLRNVGGSLTGGKNALYYGMDGEWTAHTVYVSKDDGTLTVRGSVRNIVGSETDKENLQGKQWVYGGMRMGGRSYYALDLTNIDNPKIKFHIDPATGKVYSAAHPTGKAFAAISNMGQSWSKPKIDYVNWKGQRKLVMFVGGGYDAGGADGDGLFNANGVRTGYSGYENFKYKQQDSTFTKKTIGSGVYMFDADTGDLLWHAGSDTDADLKNTDLKYSVASEIKTIDRNNDGVVDHLYFGDLAGQAFRVDFKNDGASTFTTQINKILDLNKTDGTSPRFYLPPTFTAHKSAGKTEGGNIVVVSFISGNKSSPLLATIDSPAETGQKNSTDLQYDAVYAIYDYDIFPDGSNFPTTVTTARSKATDTTASKTKLKLITATTNANNNVGATIGNWGGWYYLFDKGIPVASGTNVTVGSRNAGVVKGLTSLVAMEGNLYVTMYDASEAGTTSSCGAGVKGKSFTKRICLPTGVCAEDADYTYDLGPGIVSLNVGSSDTGGNTIIVPNPDEVCTGTGCSPCVGTACGGGSKFITTNATMRFIPNRWYERYAKAQAN
ncbi:hypothetical protein [Acinetobacter puyangensis]|uniref:hypothetical protein n=1 Tax=Acinetobacter puyangensis TaxID=1096779 RepID=UPI003A4DB16E